MTSRLRTAIPAFLSVVLLFAVGHSQTNPIPNAGFENWTAGAPADWISNSVPSVMVTVSQTATAHSGTSALQGNVVSVVGSPVPPIVYSSFPIGVRYAALTGWYTYAPTAASDSFIVDVIVYKSTIPIGAGVFSSPATVSSYTQFSAPIEYINAEIPDSAYILISTEVGQTTGATGFKLDDLAFTGVATGVADQIVPVPEDLTIQGNYPNPFNPSTQIRYTLGSLEHVQVSVFNVLGQEVARLLDAPQTPGQHQITWNAEVPSGLYLYRITATNASGKNTVRTGRMTLLK